MVQKMLGICEAKNGSKADKLMHAGTGTKDFGTLVKRIQTLEEGRVPAKEAENRWRKEKNHEKGVSKFEMEDLMAQKGLWKLAKEKRMKERGELPNEEGDAVKEEKRRKKRTKR